MDNILARFKTVSTLIFDVDGVMTDAVVQVNEAGQLLRSVSIKDGFALKYAVQQGFRIAVITGGSSKGLISRFASLGITDYYSGVQDKLSVLTAYLERHRLQAENVLYMGDDIPDLEVLKAVGLPCAPADACPEVLAAATYISDRKGGAGCVRDVIERVLKLQNLWLNT